MFTVEKRGEGAWAVMYGHEVWFWAKTESEAKAYIAGFEACVELDG